MTKAEEKELEERLDKIFVEMTTGMTEEERQEFIPKFGQIIIEETLKIKERHVINYDFKKGEQKQ